MPRAPPNDTATRCTAGRRRSDPASNAKRSSVAFAAAGETLAWLQMSKSLTVTNPDDGKCLIYKAGPTIANDWSSSTATDEVTMKLIKILSIAVFSAVMVSPIASNAGVLQIRVWDTSPGSALVITDQNFAPATSTTAPDQSLAPGVVFWSGGFGNWTLTLGLGTSNYDPLKMGFTSAVTYVGGGGGVGKLHIDITQTGLSVPGGGPAPTSFSSFGSGTGDGSASWSTYADGTNAAFGTTSPLFTSSGYLSASGTSTASLSTFYSASIFSTFDYSGLNTAGTVYHSSLDLGMKVPEPASIALVGIALLALGAAARRKA